MTRGRGTIRSTLIKTLTPRSHYLLAVSGGMDSSVLLHACVKVAPLLKLTLSVAHVDHRLRPQSGRDADFVRRKAEALGLSFFLHTLEAVPKGENVEAWARRERYHFFRGIVAAHSMDAVVTAHTASDVSETFLMRLLSNKELKSIEQSSPSRRVQRPLLTVSREMIEDYAREEGVEYVEDETNADQSILRNRVRHALIPVLTKQFTPKATQILSERAGAIAEDLRALDEIAASHAERVRRLPWGAKEWRRELKAVIEVSPSALGWRIVAEVFRAPLGFTPGRSLSRELALLVAGRRAGVNLPGGGRAQLRGGGIVLTKSTS